MSVVEHASIMTEINQQDTENALMLQFLFTYFQPSHRDLDVISKILVKSTDSRQRFNTSLERCVDMICGVEWRH